MILTDEENRFLQYWEENRNRKKSLIWKLAAGLPLGVVMALAILVNVYAGWFKGAAVALKVNTQLLFVVILAIIGMVVFIVVFSSRHQWEMNEQRYQELLFRKNKSD